MKTARVRKWIEFMEKLPRKQFNVTVWSNKCGTVCCAAGWLPTIFPRNWKMFGRAPRLRSLTDNHDVGVPDQVAAFMGIGEDDTYSLIVPGYLPSDITPKRWAKEARKLWKIDEEV